MIGRHWAVAPAVLAAATGAAGAQSRFDGWHAGVFLGYDSHNPDATNRVVDGGVEQFRYRITERAGGVGFGLYGGYGVAVLPSLYLGGDLEIGLSTADARNTTGAAVGTNTYAATVRHAATWSVTPAVRLGWIPLPDLMLYGRLGLSVQRYRNDLAAIRNGFTADQRTERNWGAGPRLGLGAEYALTDRITLRGEWNYTWIGGAEIPSRDLSLGTPVPNALNVSPGQSSLRFGIGYRF